MILVDGRLDLSSKKDFHERKMLKQGNYLFPLLFYWSPRRDTCW